MLTNKLGLLAFKLVSKNIKVLINIENIANLHIFDVQIVFFVFFRNSNRNN